MLYQSALKDILHRGYSGCKHFSKLQPNNILILFACVLSKHDDIRERHTLAYKPNVHEPPYTVFIFSIMKTLSVMLEDYSKQNASRFIVYNA